MINKKKIKNLVVTACRQQNSIQFNMFLMDYLNTSNFYEKIKTGNERFVREEDAKILKKDVRAALAGISQNEEIRTIKNSDFNAWIIAELLEELKPEIEKIAKEKRAL